MFNSISINIFIAKGEGNSNTVSTSKTKNNTANVKKYKEKGVRAPFKWSSNPHSMGFILSNCLLVLAFVRLSSKIITKTIEGMNNEIKILSQNILYKGTPSGTPTMLRLISPFGESDGRFVHTSGHNSS